MTPHDPISPLSAIGWIASVVVILIAAGFLFGYLDWRERRK